MRINTLTFIFNNGVNEYFTRQSEPYTFYYSGIRCGMRLQHTKRISKLKFFEELYSKENPDLFLENLEGLDII